MSRDDGDRLADILDAIQAIRSHMRRGELTDDLVYDAVRVRLIEIGEAVKSLSVEMLDSEPGIPWRDVAAMRDRLAHHSFATSSAIVASTVTTDLPELEAAVGRMASRE